VIVGLSYLNLRVPAARRVLDGRPIVLVVDGEPVERNLRSQRITMEDLLSQAREEQLASLSDVRWAILENSGKISFVPKSSS
jgi:uncharacterized membrane protein YcaP (DUF421 family)